MLYFILFIFSFTYIGKWLIKLKFTYSSGAQCISIPNSRPIGLMAEVDGICDKNTSLEFSSFATLGFRCRVTGSGPLKLLHFHIYAHSRHCSDISTHSVPHSGCYLRTHIQWHYRLRRVYTNGNMTYDSKFAPKHRFCVIAIRITCKNTPVREWRHLWTWA